jgi:hypothetical protein
MPIPATSHTPANPNPMHPNKFIVSFTALPNIEYWCHSANIPGLSLGEALLPTPFIDLYSPGDKLNINPFSMTFIVDENLLGWMEVYTWMRGMTFPDNFTEYKNLDKRVASWRSPHPQFSDAMLVVLDSKQNPRIRVKFSNCFPTSLTDILLSSTSSPDDPITADATFRFDLCNIERI